MSFHDIMSSSEDDDEFVEIRNPRVYRSRINYSVMEDTYKFNERFRMTTRKFYELVEMLEPNLTRTTEWNKPLSAKMQVEIALHWLGTGAQYHAVADMHGVSKTSACRAVHSVVNAVLANMLNVYVRWPENVENVVRDFHAIAGMPMVCGCVDGILVNIDAPRQHEPAYVDRHGNHSINTMVVCGPKYEFYYCFANWPGSVHDARVLRTSGLYTRMENGWRPINNGIILGDSAYPLKEWLITPLARNLDEAELRFLRSHKSTRRVIENAIGILKEKFPCLNYLRLNRNFACDVFSCCVTLYNFVREDNIENEARAQDLRNDVEREEVVFNLENPIDRNSEESLQNIYRHFRRVN